MSQEKPGIRKMEVHSAKHSSIYSTLCLDRHKTLEL